MRKFFLSILAFIATMVASAQTVYTFQGSGNWSDSSNWLNRNVPPTSLPKTDTVIVDPTGGGECVLDELFFVADSASLQVRPGKKFRLLQGIASSQAKLSDRLHVIDSTVLQLVSDSAQLSQGIYEFTSNDTIPAFAEGDFIAGSTGNGYLRKITGITYLRPLPNQRTSIFRVIINSIKAALAEVVEIGSFSVSTPVNFSLPLPGFNETDGDLGLQITNANITYNSDWEMTMEIADNRVEYFELVSSGGALNGSFDAAVNCSGVGEWQTETPIKKLTIGRIPVMIGQLPAYIAIEAEIVLKAYLKVNNDYNRQMHFSINNPIDLGVRYKNRSWNRIYKTNDPLSISVEQYNKQDRDAIIRITLGPEISFRLYGAAGPYFFAGITGAYEENFQLASGKWDVKTEVYGQGEQGVNVEIMDVNMLDLSKQEKETPRLTLYNAPDTVIKISGDEQSGLFDAYLAQPLRVRVTDNSGTPLKDVPVFYSVIEGGGSVENQRVLTDPNGYAQTRWKLGVAYGAKQVVEARVEKVNGMQVSMPARFTAKTPTLVGQWKLKSFANGVLPGTLVDVYDTSCTNILRYRYTELVDDLNIDTTDFSNYNEERVVGSGIGWNPATCAVVSNGPGTDTVYRTTTAGTYLVTGNNTITYFVDGQEVASYSFQFITFDRIKGGENEYERQ